MTPPHPAPPGTPASHSPAVLPSPGGTTLILSSDFSVLSVLVFLVTLFGPLSPFHWLILSFTSLVEGPRTGGGPGDRAGGLDPLSGACRGPERQRAGTPPTPSAEWPEEVRGCGLAAQALTWAPRGELPAAELPPRRPCRAARRPAPPWAPASHVDPHGRPRAHPSSLPPTHLVPVIARLWVMPLLCSGFCFLQLENSFLFSGLS